MHSKTVINPEDLHLMGGALNNEFENNTATTLDLTAA